MSIKVDCNSGCYYIPDAAVCCGFINYDDKSLTLTLLGGVKINFEVLSEEEIEAWDKILTKL